MIDSYIILEFCYSILLQICKRYKERILWILIRNKEPNSSKREGETEKEKKREEKKRLTGFRRFGAVPVDKADLLGKGVMR